METGGELTNELTTQIQVVNPFSVLFDKFDIGFGSLISLFMLVVTALLAFDIAKKAFVELLISLDIIQPTPKYWHEKNMLENEDYADAYNARMTMTEHERLMRTDEHYRFMHEFYESKDETIYLDKSNSEFTDEIKYNGVVYDDFDYDDDDYDDECRKDREF